MARAILAYLRLIDTDILSEIGKAKDPTVAANAKTYYFSSDRSYMDRFEWTIRFCLAHLIRDVMFLTTLRMLVIWTDGATTPVNGYACSYGFPDRESSHLTFTSFIDTCPLLRDFALDLDQKRCPLEVGVASHRGQGGASRESPSATIDSRAA